MSYQKTKIRYRLRGKAIPDAPELLVAGLSSSEAIISLDGIMNIIKDMFRKKPLPSASETGHGLRRHLSAWDLAGIGIGCMVGVGIFVLPGVEAAGHAGPAISLSFLLAAIAVSFTALAYAELSSMMPVSGSAYSYSLTTFGILPAWLVGWSLLLEYLVGAAMVAIGWSAYLAHLLKGFGVQLPAALAAPTFGGGILNLPALLIVLSVMAVVLVGVKESARITLILVVVKIGAVLVFLWESAPHINPVNWSPFMPMGFSGVLTAAAVAFIAFGGFDAICTAAEEAKNPQRDLPIGLMVALVVVALAYVAVAATMTGVVPFRQLDVADPMTVVLTAARHPWISRVVSVAALAGIGSVLLAMLLAQPRIVFAMAKDGLLPGYLAEVHPRFGTPFRSTVISGVVVAAMAGLLPIQVIAELCSMGFLVASMSACLSVFMLRRTHPQRHRPFRVPFAGVVAPLGIACCLLLIAMLPQQTLLRYGVWLTAGLGVYLLRRKSIITTMDLWRR